MNIDYKKYLPTSLRTNRWGEFIEMFQSIMTNNVYIDKVEAIKNQYNLNKATDLELKNLAWMMGFDLSIFTGYCSTLYYLQKELLTIVPRIKNKTTRKGYFYISHCFDLIGDIIPTANESPNIEPIYDYLSIVAGAGAVVTLDWGAFNIIYIRESVAYDVDFVMDFNVFLDTQTPVYGTPATPEGSDAFIDTDIFPTLDLIGGVAGRVILRHLVYSYKYKFVETITEFQTENTCKALLRDILQMKRRTELVYFQPELHIKIKSDNTTVTFQYTDYQKTITVNQYSRLVIGNNLTTDVTKIRFGTGSYDLATINALTIANDVDNFSYELDHATEMFKYEVNENVYNASTLMTDKFKVTNKIGLTITEFSLENSLGNMIMYTTFPLIRWTEKMYQSLRLIITFET